MRKILFLVLSFLFFNLLTAQVINEPLNSKIYNFLSNLSQKGIIDYNDLFKPLSRFYIAEKLLEAEKSFVLTKLDNEELNYYKKEFGYEIEKLKSEFNQGITKSDENLSTKPDAKNTKPRSITDKSWEFEVLTPSQINEKGKDIFYIFKRDKYDRYRPFSYQNEITYLNLSPILGYEIGNWEKLHYSNLRAGVKFNGYFGDFLGFDFEVKATRQEPGTFSFLYNRFSKNTKIDLQLADSKRVEHTTVNIDLATDWSWGSFVLGKNYLNWGYGESGKIVLSEKAPSFPYIRLDLYPAEWFSFHYIHAWLNSDVVDSNSFYPSFRYAEYGKTNRFTYIQKFLALHSVTITPFKGLDFSFGESIVYSDNLQILYLIPLMFFDLGDEYLNRNDNYAGGSTQLFLSLSSRNHLKNTHLYASFHADELTPEGLFDPKTQYYKFAFTFGGKVIDLPLENLGLLIEYTKVYPGNYRHFIPTLTYESSSALMGHWIGDNGDLFYAAFDYKILRGLNVKLWGQYIRKGTEALGNRAYKVQIPQPGFLFLDRISDRKNYTYYGFNVNYEITHDLIVDFHYQYIDYEQAISKEKFRSSLNRDFSLSLGYGI